MFSALANNAIGIAEAPGLTVALVAADTMAKTAAVHVLQAELNDLGGVCLKVGGPLANVRAALDACATVAEQMGVRIVRALLTHPTDTAISRGILSRLEFSPLIDQPVVFEPATSASVQAEEQRENSVDNNVPSAIGLIETQGYTAVLEAIDTACKAANVRVLGKEKLGGGYITVLVEGDVAAVQAAVDAGRQSVGELGRLIAAHVISRPSPAVMSLLPRA